MVALLRLGKLLVSGAIITPRFHTCAFTAPFGEGSPTEPTLVGTLATVLAFTRLDHDRAIDGAVEAMVLIGERVRWVQPDDWRIVA